MQTSPSIQHTLDRISDIMQLFHKMEGAGQKSPGVADPSSSLPKPGESVVPDPLAKSAARERPEERLPFQALIEKAGQKHGVAPSLIRAIMETESGGRVDARSTRGAVGLMQLMPDTAKRLGVDPLDPSQNIDGGVRYLKNMANRFDTLDQTLAAYNAGPGAVKKYGRVPPYQETRNYINRVREHLRSLEKLDESHRSVRNWRR